MYPASRRKGRANIDFAWARRITSQKVTTAGAVRKELRDTRPYKPAHMGDEEWASAVAFTEHRLAVFADTDELVYHRYVAATPKVLIWYTNDRKGTVPDAVHHAALPVFFRAGDQLPSVRPLQPYEPQPERETAPPPAGQPNGYPAGRKRRKDSHQLVPVLPELNLYRRVSPENAR